MVRQVPWESADQEDQMARMNVAQFLDRIAVDDALQEQLVGLGAERGFDFTKDELTDAEPGVTAEPRTWRHIAGFPDLSVLSSAPGAEVARQSRKAIWRNKTSVLAATNVVLYGSLVWLMWRNRRRAA
jgi:hypothetical protein